MLLYLSGPMSGIEEFNYPAFNKAAAILRERGHDVINPAETAGGITHLDRTRFMEIDVGYVMAADAVVVMEGWGRSKGAQLEVLLAANLGKPIYAYCPIHGFDYLVEVVASRVIFNLHDLSLVEDDEPEDDDEDDLPFIIFPEMGGGIQ